jgi:hypothetical protein
MGDRILSPYTGTGPTEKVGKELVSFPEGAVERRAGSGLEGMVLR